MQSKATLNQLWKQNGQQGSFKDFCEKFNSSRFKNFTGGGGTSQTPPVVVMADTKPAVLIADTIPLPAKSFDKKEGALWVALGIAVGVVAVLSYNKLQ